VALGGGIPALDYTYSSLERFPGQPAGPSAYETFVEPFDVVDPEPEPVDEAHAAFLAELARARTRLATGYLAYGRRLGEPQPVRSWPVIELGWKRYNASQGKQPGEKKVVDQGRHAVPAVVGSAWWDEMSGKVGILLVQLGEAEFTATLRLELERYPLLNGHSVRLTRRSTDDGAAEPLGELKRGEPRELELTLPSRRVVLLELAGGE